MEYERLHAKFQNLNFQMAESYVTFYVVLIALIISIFQRSISYLSAQFSSLWSSDKQELRILKRRIDDTSSQLAQMSMVDEFAAYSRKKRELTSLKSKLQQLETNQCFTSIKGRLIVTVFLYLTLLLVTLFHVYSLYGLEFCKVPKNWFWPLSWILFRRSEDGENDSVSYLFLLSLSTCFWQKVLALRRS